MELRAETGIRGQSLRLIIGHCVPLHSPEHILQTYWHYPSFRPLQKEIILSVLQQQDTLALLPTGGGKSLCFQVPALMREGFCLVVSPLIALMQDQVSRLKEKNISATCLHAGMHFKEVERTLRNAAEGGYKLLYVSPERLQSHLFQEFLPSFDINLIAVDEAHCVSQWGHDFRPEYLKISFLREVFPRVPMLALTATATEEVQDDIAHQLKLKRWKRFRASFRRDNIYYELRRTDNKLQEVIDALAQPRGSAIVYCRSRKQTELLNRQLKDFGLSSVCYHAGMSKELREASQHQWMKDEAAIMVATTAFGMGIDKANVRTVVHYEPSEHPEAYYQEAGRAGRDGQPSKALMLYNKPDLQRLEESTALHFPPTAYLRKVYQSVCEYLQLPVGVAPDRYFNFDIADFCRKFDLPAVPTSNALRLLQQEGLWTISEAVFQPATVFVNVDRSVLDSLAISHPNLAFVATHLLRLHGSLFYYPTPIKLAALARNTKLRQDVVHEALMHLDNMQVIEYTQPKEGAQLFFHHLRADANHLLIDVQRIHRLRSRHEARTKALLQFLTEQDTCRERFLLNYFNETTNTDCRHCDICTQRYAVATPGHLLRQQVAQILKHPISAEAFAKKFSAKDKTAALELLRIFLDEGLIIRDVNGLLCLKKSPTE